MCVLMDVEESGLFLTSTKSLSPKPVFTTKGERSVMRLLSKIQGSSLVKLDRADTLEMLFLERFSHVRLVANSSPVKSRILHLMDASGLRSPSQFW